MREGGGDHQWEGVGKEWVEKMKTWRGMQRESGINKLERNSVECQTESRNGKDKK
jgi:hypothetical protein